MDHSFPVKDCALTPPKTPILFLIPRTANNQITLSQPILLSKSFHQPGIRCLLLFRSTALLEDLNEDETITAKKIRQADIFAKEFAGPVLDYDLRSLGIMTIILWENRHQLDLRALKHVGDILP
jgi:hypothetical protein